MTSALASPDPLATRSHAADWLELMAVVAAPRTYRSSQYVSALTLEDRDPDGEGFGDDDPEIVAEEFDELLERATDEIRWRMSVLGALYPFQLAQVGRGWSLAYRRSGRAPERLAQDVYVACLLMSGTRHSRFDRLPDEIAAPKSVADTFQAVVYLVSPALLGGPSFWIAFPRPERDDYGPALRRLTTAIGSGKTKLESPPTQRSNKDGGVDIVTWRGFADQRSNLIVSYGQVATGKGWRDKSVKNKLSSHYDRWFDEKPVSHFLPAMYIPHLMHEELKPEHGYTFEELVKDDAYTLEHQLGVVVDRIRMALLVPAAYAMRGARREPDATHLRTVLSWVNRTKRALQKPPE